MVLLNDEERRAVYLRFRSHRGVPVSRWSERHVRIPAREGAVPGRLDLSLTPYLRGWMDAFSDGRWERLKLRKCAQWGGNVGAYAMLCWAVVHAPGATQFVKTTQDDSRTHMTERLLPFLRACGPVAEMLASAGPDEIDCGTQIIRASYPTSPRTQKSWPYCYGFLDELDDLDEAGSGDPVQLAYDRTTTFGRRRRIVMWGTPKSRTGPVWREWVTSPIQMQWHVPCLACGGFQVLDFFRGVRWPRDLAATPAGIGRIRAEDLVTYRCDRCGRDIRPADRRRMNDAGVWADPRHQRIDGQGRPAGELPPSDQIAFAADSLFSPFVRWGEDVAQYLEGDRDPAKRQVWWNQRRGREFEQPTGRVDEAAILRRCREGHPAGAVPPWTCRLLAAADVQKHCLWWIVRAYGPGGRSRLVAFGRSDDFESLRAAVLRSAWPVQGDERRRVPVQTLAVDMSGGKAEGHEHSRPEEVCRFAETDPRVIVYKGRNPGKAGGPEQYDGRVQLREGRYAALKLRMFWPDWYKNVLARTLHEDDPAAPWELHRGCDAEYLRQMTAEERIWLPADGYQTWKLLSDAGDNHLWDCEVMLAALADYRNCRALTDGDRVATGRASAGDDPVRRLARMFAGR